MATASGVRLPRIRIGITGSGLIQVSATTNAIHDNTLPISNPQTLISLHSNPSTLFSVKPRRRDPTAEARVMEPSQSIRASFWRRVRGRCGSGMFTWIATSRAESARHGSWRRKAARQPIVSFSKPPKGPPRPAPAPKRLTLVRTPRSSRGPENAYMFAIPIAPIVSRRCGQVKRIIHLERDRGSCWSVTTFMREGRGSRRGCSQRYHVRSNDARYSHYTPTSHS